ncbi:hypothetical protein [Caldithrix abyssi]
MKLNPKQNLIFSLLLLMISLAAHVSIFLGAEIFPRLFDLFLTGGMVVSWLLSSRFLKQLHKNQPALPPMQVLRSNTPFWLPFFVAFVGLYAVINMGMMIRTNWAGSNLRGISGFWMFFFALGVLVSLAKIRQEKGIEKKHLNAEDTGQ